MALIRLENVVLTFDNQPLFHQLSFELFPRQRIALMGVSGVGKSTLLNLLAGLVKPQSGEITWQTDRIGYVFQDPRLLPWLTVQQNLELVLKGKGIPDNERKQRICDVLARVHLSHKEHLYPHQLSGGMAQRVGLARAFVIRPDVLLLDEPFSALDKALRQSLSNMLASYLDSNETAAVYVSHHPDEALPVSRQALVLTRTAKGCQLSPFKSQQSNVLDVATSVSEKTEQGGTYDARYQ